MPEAPVPFANKQASGYDELSGASPVAMNVVVDGAGCVLRRPGIVATGLAPSTAVDSSGLVGLYRTIGGTLVAVGGGVAERAIYAVTSGGAVKLGGGVPGTGLRGTGRPTFAETEMLLVLAGGADVQKVELASLRSSRLGGSPPLATHVLANASRLLLNDVSVDLTKVRFSDVFIGTTSFANAEVWSLGGIGTSGYFTAEGKPDPVIAVHEDTNEVLVFGSQTLQSFVPDAQLTYAPVATREIGLSAAYSVIKYDQDFYWIDHLRRIVAGGARNYDSISDAIQKTLDQMTTFSDAWGAKILVDFADCLLWTFPTDGRSFMFQKGIGWSQWAGQSGGNWAPLGVGCVFQPFDGTDPIVGMTDGRIGTFSFDAATDFGTPIRASVRTGYQNHDTDKLKLCRALYLSLRRGETTSTTGPQALLRWRDRPGAWEAEVPVDLGASGDTEIMVPLRGLGTYRRRQWEFEYMGTERLALVGATEDFQVLSS